MPNTKSKRNIIIVLVILIIGGFLYFYYFSKKNNNESKNKTETPAANEDFSLSLKKLQNLGEFSQVGGEELLGILNLLQTLKLDISFFQSEKFKKPSDFYRIVEIKDEEKGNINLFKVQ